MNAEEFFEKQEKKEKVRKRLQLAAIPLYYAIYIPLMVLCWRADSEHFCYLLIFSITPVIYYLAVFKIELLFMLTTMFNFYIDDPEPPDWYGTYSHIGGYVSMIIGLFLTLVAYVYALID